jgi:hypothetical protein
MQTHKLLTHSMPTRTCMCECARATTLRQMFHDFVCADMSSLKCEPDVEIAAIVQIRGGKGVKSMQACKRLCSHTRVLALLCKYTHCMPAHTSTSCDRALAFLPPPSLALFPSLLPVPAPIRPPPAFHQPSHCTGSTIPASPAWRIHRTGWRCPAPARSPPSKVLAGAAKCLSPTR